MKIVYIIFNLAYLFVYVSPAFPTTFGPEIDQVFT